MNTEGTDRSPKQLLQLCLIGNYPPDKQESMIRFCQWLEKAANAHGISTTVISPTGILAKNRSSTLSGIGKWLGYIDKFILFPRQLKKSVRSSSDQTIFHVVDHSNAYYMSFLPKARSVITCHDVLAIRGGLGDKDAWCNSSKLGGFFQKWILKHLQRSSQIIFVSENSKNEFSKLPRIQNTGTSPRLHVIYNGLNTKQFSSNVLGKSPSDSPFFFHIGSSLPRKNRKGIIEAFETSVSELPANYCLIFAGEPFSILEREVVERLEPKVSARISNVGRLTNEQLASYYTHAAALVFPSFSEGFGWPIIEAQACGCPVIVGELSALPEIAGESALL